MRYLVPIAMTAMLAAAGAAADQPATTRYVGPIGPDGQLLEARDRAGARGGAYGNELFQSGGSGGGYETQWVQPRPLMPVDRAVGDLDPRAVSQRWMDPGRASFMPGPMLYTEGFGPQGFDDGSAGFGLPSVNPSTGLAMSGRYRYEAPGVRAWMDRPDYLVRTGPGRYDLNLAPGRDGEALQLIPPGTVFNLLPPDMVEAAAEPEVPAGEDHRIDGRIDGRVDGRVRPFDVERRERLRRQGRPVRR